MNALLHGISLKWDLSQFYVSRYSPSEYWSEYDIILRSALLLGWYRHVCLEFEISSVKDTYKTSLHFFMRLSDAYALGVLPARLFFIADCFSLVVLIGTQFKDRRVNSICCVDQQAQFSTDTSSLLGSDLSAQSVRSLDFMENYYNGLTTDRPVDMMDNYPNIMHHNVTLCLQATMPFLYKTLDQGDGKDI